MKNLIIALISALIATSCVSGLDQIKNTSRGDNNIIKNIVTTKEYSIAVQPNKVSVVRVGDDIIAVADEPMTILVAKSDSPTTTFVSADEANNLLDEIDLTKNSSQMWQVVAFEDSRKGDYDYNDLVFHVKYEFKPAKLDSDYNTNGNDRQFSFAIQPIALGSTKKIALGCDIYKGSTLIKAGVIVAADCREKFFNGTEPHQMINTTTAQREFCTFDYKPYFGSNLIYYNSDKQDNAPFYVNWFIIVDENAKLYAVSTNRTTDMVNADKRPYGIVLTNTGNKYQDGVQSGKVGADWFDYPKENVAIDDVYPKFGAWLSGEYTGEFADMYNDPSNDMSKAFKAIDAELYIVRESTDVFGKPTVKSHVIPLARTQAEIDSPDMKF